MNSWCGYVIYCLGTVISWCGYLIDRCWYYISECGVLIECVSYPVEGVGGGGKRERVGEEGRLPYPAICSTSLPSASFSLHPL